MPQGCCRPMKHHFQIHRNVLLYMSCLFVQVPTKNHSFALLFSCFPYFSSPALPSCPSCLIFVFSICPDHLPHLLHSLALFQPLLSSTTLGWCPSIYVSVLFPPHVPFASLGLRSLPSPPLQACKPNHSAEGGGSGQSLPPHVGSLGQAEDQSCAAKRRRASSPTKVNT